ncbi:CDP-alcohol phosphatidyltransferase family protein [Erythrobacter sp. NFXS35]|uniref:CDP-alcohol phosphatidyltransferase family protein n=1 Tax=Erythrobacter sp. NFXS35 TaxID=2818436 RepID=UPI0032E00149
MIDTAAFRFVSARTANRLVAGVPAAARIARAYAEVRAGAPSVPMPVLVLVLEDGGDLSPFARAEIARLAPSVAAVVESGARQDAIPGETLPDAAAIAALIAEAAPVLPSPADPDATLEQANRKIIRATAKPGDGIVSRRLNRPLSQAVSALLLRFDWVRPGQATALTGAIALTMAACLLTGTFAGLVAGAVLFQIASIADGIDGEIARATYRTSPSGAAWDSAVDAATNLGFLGGVIANLALRGQTAVALIGLAGLGILALGMGLLGQYARARGEPLNFDGAKALLAGRETALTRWLRYLTMRDFYCLFLAVTIALGWVTAALTIFTAAAAVWLMAVIALLVRARAPARRQA